MPTRDIKTRFSLEGESEYRRALNGINDELGILRSEMKVVDSAYQSNKNSMEALESKGEVLGKQYDAQSRKLETLRSALKNAQNSQDGLAQRVAEAKAKYEQAKSSLSEYEKSTDKTEEGQKQLKDALEAARKEFEVAQRSQEQNEKSIVSYQKQVNNAQAALNEFGDELEQNNRSLLEARSAAQNVGEAVDDLGDRMQDTANDSRELGDKSSDAIATLASVLATAGIKEGLEQIAAAIKECTDASLTFESAVTGVYKTVDGTPEQLQQISDGIKQMSTEIPVSTARIAEIAEAAGQLGIKTEDVLAFSRVMLDLGESTNLSAEEAASALAKFANITGTAAGDYSRLGSVIVGLGNNFATTEADIVAMSTRLASGGKLAGMTEPQIMALATAMSSVGIEAEAGGTAMTQTLASMEKAVAKGGDDLERFAQIAGMSAKEFSNRWKTNAVSALQEFISGLGKLDEKGESATIVLDEMGLSGIRQSNMLKSLALASDTLTSALELANTSWTENTALTEEAGKRYETTESKIQMAKNAFDNLKVSVGDQLKPALEGIAEAGTDAFTWAAEFVEENPWVVGAITSVTTAMAALAIGVGGYTAATKLAIPMIGQFTAALMTNPVGQVAVGVTALVSALAGLTIAFANAEPPEDRYKEKLIAARQATNDLEEAIENLDNTIEKNQYDTDQVEVYIEQLKRLEERGLENIGVNQLYQETVEKINEIMPELGATIDETTGAVEGGTDALMLHAEAWAEQENAAEALRVLEDAKNVYEETSLAIEENSAQMEAYREQWNMMAEEQASVEPYSTRWWELNNAMGVIVTETIPAFQAQDEALREELALQQEQVDAAQASYDTYNQTVAAGNDTSTSALEIIENFNLALDSVQSELQALQEEYQAAYDSAYTNISGQFGLFQTMDEVVAVSVSDMISSLQSQSAYMDEYAENLRRAAELGVDQGLIEKLSDGSEESARILKGIADDGGENVDELNKNFQKVEEGKKSFSSELAKMQTDFDRRMTAIDKRLAESVEEFNQSGEARDNTNQTINAVVNTAYARVGEIRSAYAYLARQANYAYRSTLDINSPSRVFEYNTKMTIEAITGTTKKSEPEVQKSYRSLAGASTSAYYGAALSAQQNYENSMRSYNRAVSDMPGTGAGRILQELSALRDELRAIRDTTAENKPDNDGLIEGFADAVSHLQVNARAVISAREASETLAPEVDKKQGDALALRKRGVI